jgi:hypothetical protein
MLMKEAFQYSFIKQFDIALASARCCQAELVYPELVDGKPKVVASLLFQTVMQVYVIHPLP